MPLRLLLACALPMLVAVPSFAGDAAPETTIQVYRVSDLVAYDALNRTTGFGEIQPEEWRNEHAETTAALQRLVVLVESMCSTKATVLPHSETLSLVVRHTADGHREIEQLLDGLRANNEPLIRLTFQLIDTPGEEPLKSVPQEKRKRAVDLLKKKILTPDEATETRELFAEPDSSLPKRTVQLVAGRKTSWEFDGRPASATACVSPDNRSVRLRIDYVTNDDIGDGFPVVSDVFEIENGSSAILLQSFDSAGWTWLITPTIVGPVQAAEARQ